MNKKEKKIFIIVTVILGLILLVVSQGKFRNLSVATDSSSTSYKIFKTLTLTDACGECGGTCYPISDYAICCEIPGWTLDPSTEECNPPPPEDCGNDPSKMPDCSRYCTVPGQIIDYSADLCCPPSFPFYGGGNLCYTIPQPNSDNYYTRRSECTSTSQTKCEGLDLTYLYQCTESPQFIYRYANKGQVIGQCGIECFSMSDCPGNLANCAETTSCDYSCGGNTCIAVGTSYYFRLENNLCNLIYLLPSQVTSIDYTTELACQSNIPEVPTTFFRFEDNKCTEITLLPSQKTSIDYTTKKLCESNIKGTNYELIIGIIIILGIIGFVIYRFKGKRRSK